MAENEQSKLRKAIGFGFTYGPGVLASLSFSLLSGRNVSQSIGLMAGTAAARGLSEVVTPGQNETWPGAIGAVIKNVGIAAAGNLLGLSEENGTSLAALTLAMEAMSSIAFNKSSNGVKLALTVFTGILMQGAKLLGTPDLQINALQSLCLADAGVIAWPAVAFTVGFINNKIFPSGK
jgi:hypothetical protein